MSKLKVHDIRSFFKQPGRGSSREASSSRELSEDQIVEVPSRLKKGSSKKSKKDEDRLNVSIERSEEDGDSDREEPLQKSKRAKKEDKKRKAKVLSDSDDDDDFKPSQKKKTSPSSEKPAAKLAKVEKAKAESKEKDLKPVNPADFFGSAPVKRESKKDPKKVEQEQKPSSCKTEASPGKKETKKSPEKKVPKPVEKQQKPSSCKTEASPENKETKKSPVKVEVASTSKASPTKTKTHSGKHELESPHKPSTSLIEPKKLKMETLTPEKRDKANSKPSKVESPPKTNGKATPKKTPEKKENASFKVPTPVTLERSKSRTKSASTPKRSLKADDDEEEDDFNPRQKASSSKGRKSKSDMSDTKRDKTPKKSPKNSSTDDEKDDATKQAQKQNYAKYLAKMSIKPKNLGSKVIPVGAPGCLQDLAFVISGVLDSLEREDCTEIIKKYGGRVTGSVSGKTSYLIIGDDPGESKVKKAVQLKVPQISEDDLLEMLRKSNPSGNSQDSGLEYSEDMHVDSEPFKTEDEYDADKSLFNSPANASKSSPRKSARSPSKLAKEDRQKEEVNGDVQKERSCRQAHGIDVGTDKNGTQNVTSHVIATTKYEVTNSEVHEQPWVVKYCPKSLKEVIGQSSDNSNAGKLVKWLNNWFKYHGSSTDKPKAAWPGLRDPEGKTFKATLLSGPPGVGKTTMAHLAVKQVGFDYFELNASDTRNKKSLHENVADALKSKCLVFSSGRNEMSRNHAIILDEVDGASGNEDRGGIQELIALIKTSRVPVICICNDRNHPKIRSLSNWCFDLRINRPSSMQLKGFISKICFKEKVTISHERMQELITSADNDVRQILHQLELFKASNSDKTFSKKDERFGPWDVIRKVFLKSDHEKMSIHDKNHLFFQDYNIGPLFVQENYPKWVPAKAHGNRYVHMNLLNKTASSLADGDLVESAIRRTQHWELLPVQAVFSSFLPGEYMESDRMGGVEFPQWLGKNSNKNKRHRLLENLHSHLQLQVSGSVEALNMDYLPYLRRAITKPLVAGNAVDAARVMEDYSLIRDDLESIQDLAMWPGMKDPMQQVETRIKTNFTKLVNKEVLPYSITTRVKQSKQSAAEEEESEDLKEEQEEVPGVEEEDEEEPIEKDAMIKVRTRKAGSSKTEAKTSAPAKKPKTASKKKDRNN